MRRGIAIVTLWALGACATAGPWPPLDTGPIRRKAPKDTSVLLESATTLTFSVGSSGPVLDRVVRSQFLLGDEKGRRLANSSFYYDSEFQSVLSAHARVSFPDGTSRDFFREDFTDHLAGGDAFYSKGRVLSWSKESLPLGSIVESEAVIREHRPDLFAYGFPFAQRDVETEWARLEVFAPADWELETFSTLGPDRVPFPPTKDEVLGGVRHLTFERRKVKGFEEESHGPDAWSLIPFLRIHLVRWTEDGVSKQALSTFRDLSRATFDLQKDTDASNGQIEALVHELLAQTPPDPEARARRLFEWVRDEIRYLAIEVGLGGWRSIEAEETFANRSGDCKGKATLLKTMLKVAGISSHMAILNAHGGLPIPLMVPKLGHANHAILSIDLPSGPLLVDPTNRFVPFGELPVSDQEAEILLARADGSEVFTSTRTSATRNRKTVILDLDLRDGAGTGTFRLETTGAFASKLRQDLSTASPESAAVEAKGWLWLDHGQVSLTDRSEAEGVTTLQGQVNVPKFLLESEGTRALRLSDLVASPGWRLSERERKYPVVHEKREHRVFELRLELPKSWSATHLPSDVKVRSGLGDFTATWRVTDRTLVARTEYHLHQRVFSPTEAPQLRVFFDQVADAYRSAVILEEVRR